MRQFFPYIIAVSLVISGCEIDQSEILPEDGFTKIYNHPEESQAFHPESVLELQDGSIIFISAVKDESSESEYPYTYIVKTSASGEMEWAQSYDWYAPSHQLIQQGNTIGFVAMNQQFNTYLISIDPSTGIETNQRALDITMPLYSYLDSRGKLLVLGYDFVSRSSWITMYDSDFSPERTTKLSINTDLEYEIQKHLNKTGQSYPFFIGEFNTSSGPGYFVNCFSNYTLRTVFLGGSGLNTMGDIYSFRTEEGISAMAQKQGDSFGLTAFFEGNNYVFPNTEIDVNSSQNIKNLSGYPLYELTFKAGVVAGVLKADSINYELFISQTNSNSLVIYQYEIDSDTLIATHYENFDDKVEVCDFIQTADNGILILASTHILGKYRRPMLLKIPEASFIPEEE